MARTNRQFATRHSPRLWTGLLGFGLVSAVVSMAAASPAQAKDENSAAATPATSSFSPSSPSRGEKSANEDLKAVERERDDLKIRNADLEMRLKQLQATVDNLVHQALGEKSVSPAFAAPPSAGMVPRRFSGPYVSQFRPIFPPFGGMPDPVELAVAFSDALGEKEVAKPALDEARQKVHLGHGATSFDVDAASARLSRADRKVRLLRNIIANARAVAADQADRLGKLAKVRAVSVVEVRNAEARLKMLDDILATDPDAAKKPADLPQPAEPK
jgi:hypothetical protein